MLNYIILKTLILFLICNGSSVQEPFGLGLLLKKPPETPKPFQFLSLFGVYNENNDHQEGSKQAKQYASRSNKSFSNPGNWKNEEDIDQRQDRTNNKANPSKLGLDESRNQKVPRKKSFIKPLILRIQPSFLIDQIKRIFFDALQPYDTFGQKTSTNTEAADKFINANQQVPKDNKTHEDSIFPGNHNKDYPNQVPEKDTQILIFNESIQNSKVSTDKIDNNVPFDLVFSPSNNEMVSTPDGILQASKVYSNETDSNEGLDNPAVDLISKPSTDFSEEFQEPAKSNYTTNFDSGKFFINQIKKSTFESYRMHQEPSKSNEATTSDKFDQLFQNTTDQSTMVLNKNAQNAESSTNKKISNEELNDFIIDFINQSIPQMKKLFNDQEISENKSVDNKIFKKSIDLDINSQLLESDSPEFNTEFNSNETTSNDHQFVEILNENNQPNSNISKLFRNPKVITDFIFSSDNPDLSNLYHTNQSTTYYNEAHEKFDLHTKIVQKKNPEDLISLETNQPDVNKDRTYQYLEDSSNTSLSKDHIDTQSFHTNLPTLKDIIQVTELYTDKTVKIDNFSELHSYSNEPNNAFSKVFGSSAATRKATVSYDNLHQFTVSQTNPFFFDFDKVFQEHQASTILEANNDVYEIATSFIPNLVETTFESDEEFQMTDTAINKTDANNSLKESFISVTSQSQTELLEIFQVPEGSFGGKAKTVTKLISDESNQTTTEHDKNIQDKYLSKTNAFNHGMFEDFIIPQTVHTEIELTEAFREIDIHTNEFSSHYNSDLETDQSTFASYGIFRNPHVPEVTEDIIVPNEHSETSPRFIQNDKSTSEYFNSTADTTGRETHNTKVTSEQATTELDNHKFLTDSTPFDFTINLPIKTSNTDNKTPPKFKNKALSYDLQNERQFIYPLCSESSNIRKLAPCDNENKFFMCNDAYYGTIKICNKTKPQNEIPLCFLDLPHGRYLVSCSTSPKKMCLYESEAETAVRYCREQETAICINEKNKLKFCQATRFKRQEPKIPKLDKDAYYAKCAKCKLQVLMDVEKNQRPVVKIRSEPYDPNNDEEKGRDNEEDGDKSKVNDNGNKGD